jgi:hypothetical protein
MVKSPDQQRGFMVRRVDFIVRTGDPLVWTLFSIVGRTVDSMVWV